ncbi:protein-export chaperone SecB [Vibrio parahaemolyticus]|uniref:protein-export chaperone SecB n=1 Tax=Vibrio parahaemolyticus TaxID=670 RepID=UPI0005B6F4CA|nr:protein-export chaperone SecB [Vibrio parahaemolyticus]KIT55517.1 hypothetical protein H334_20010 [Vibrio parahaemolyticus 901128]EGQ8484466.1 preprotein translocase subunit SecB [Vibrio parahaemolyticus]EGQ9704929.1 preprotein translocase subunit SecB [Vibrio parahaemolyticus]EGR1688735.1 preprotein translocase subunit SecB [Vibrio parahaemolyticus]EGR1756800.1 preprotein translocase subunit SecB [Vibrio parahaemolyticus]
MNLQLVSTKVEKLNLTQSEPLDIEENDLSFKFGNAYSNESPDTFQVIFEMSLLLTEDSNAQNAQLDVEYVALFKASEEIDDDFKVSPFPQVNAPAIAYPFLRAFLGTFLLNAGYEPVMLPSVNFQALYKESK